MVGSFWGRAGGLIALGVVAAVATAAATLGNDFPEDRFDYAPTSGRRGATTATTSAAASSPSTSPAISDVDALDGRDITIDGVGGRVEVIVPDGMDVTVQHRGRGRRQPGLRPSASDGFDVNLDGFRDGGDEVPDMSLTIDLVAGEIIVREAA